MGRRQLRRYTITHNHGVPAGGAQSRRRSLPKTYSAPSTDFLTSSFHAAIPNSIPSNRLERLNEAAQRV
ncbi:uncharacterized protein CLUP02_18378 [Colletotrichum lupini]|uniref:Uncharacterized protein n=1 Tax=Colletotrichum lupini TaxID=145971 RepID=A0A9Q8SGV1_9PEZI|nr:uncharacterized protein CLUP02_18378 [Colletotrichum lupini]UQC76863.1 hypothetical protein CLUP02_18378 [Colletotrichum lupini]